jgi:hypothetical protein
VRRDQGLPVKLSTRPFAAHRRGIHPGRHDGEPLREGLVAQPLSAGSSLAYVAAGLWLWHRSSTTSRPGLSHALAGSIAANGVAGIGFHGPGDRVSHALHDAALAATGVAVVASGADAASRWRRGARPNPKPALWATLAGVVGTVANIAGRRAATHGRPVTGRIGHPVWHVLTAVALALGGETLLGATERNGP